MQNKIALTDDLGQLFLALSLKERILGFNIYGKEVVPKENVGDFLLWKLKKHPTNSDLFSMLTQILILYDGIELPFYSHCLDIIGDVASFTHLTEDVYVVISVDGDTSLINGIESFSIEQAIILKPLIINRCMTKLYDNREVKNFDENRARLINSFYSYIFDCYYNEAHLKSVPDVDEFFENRLYALSMHAFRAHNREMRDGLLELKRQWSVGNTPKLRRVNYIMSHRLLWSVALMVRSGYLQMKKLVMW